MTQAQGYDPRLNAEIEESHRLIRKIVDHVGSQVIGQDHLVRRLLTALITEGHILLEGVPGLGKTLSIKTLASSVDGSFQRVQFTPDLLPSDVIGTEVFRPKDGTFEVRPGPIFANFVLADEINRAPAKVQSALLETMQEKQVTIGGKTMRVPSPFFVMATQNPIEQEGTYPLPEAQVDRFMLKVKVDYPDTREEKEMLDLVVRSKNPATQAGGAVATMENISALKTLSERVYVDEKVREYIVNLVAATRRPADFNLPIQDLIELGGSPRATISLFLAARAEALLQGETFVVPQMVKDVAHDVLRHRLLPTYEAEVQQLNSDDLVQMVLDGVEVP